MKKYVFSLAAIFFSFTVFSQIINPNDVTIVRDSFGIPHIFGKTDADCAYGLAWAESEDAFAVTQDLIYVAKGFMGRKDGIEGVKADYFVHAIGVRKLVEERYDKDLTPEFKKYISGFVQGLNAYAKAHPDEVKIKKAFPITEKDLLSAFVVTMSFLVGSQNEVGNIVGGKYDNESVNFETKHEPVGSNAFAAKSALLKEGKTFLCINPHMQMTGALSFYEMHLQSEEGLNMQGATFQGASSHAMGVNQHLGWGFTWNHFDRVDVYKLKMHPKKKGYYEFDGKYLKLEKRPVWLKVNLSKKGKFVLPVRKVTYWSKYGATLKSDKSNTFCSVRFPANMTIKTGQHLYEMAKATNYEDFWKAMRSNHALALFNMVYADDKDNIFYLSQGEMPDRKDQSYDWTKVLPGNTSKTLWTDLVPLDSMPHVINPKCGYVFNTNNDVYDATCEGQNDNPNRLPAYANQRPGNNNRAEALKEFFETHPTFSFDEIKAKKFDTHFPKTSVFLRSFDPLWHLDKTKYPALIDAIELLQTWDRNTDTNSTATALFGALVKTIWDDRHYDDGEFITGAINLNEEQTVAYLEKAVAFMKEKFGTINVRWGDVHKLNRGDKYLSMGSFADLLSPSYPELKTYNGKTVFVPKYGDTFTMFAQFGKNGTEVVESLEPL
ncbi:MAG TPA: penicillin acylase family protein [Chitinophagales bacterium]